MEKRSRYWLFGGNATYRDGAEVCLPSALVLRAFEVGVRCPP